jgi:glyoxylase-like metal-dependent hydrolase (beta-lactamase superfamily II)
MFSSIDDSEKIGREVVKNLYFFSENQMLDCNQYIIEDTNTGELNLFDAGNAISLNGLFKGMEKFNLNFKNITKVFLTHSHVDHVLGIYKLLDILKDNPPIIYAYGEAAKILEKGEERKILPAMFGLTAKKFGIEIYPLQIDDLHNFKEIQISSEFNFKIYYTPGHSLGSVCYYEPNKKILIPGDLIFIGGNFGRYDFPGGSLPTLINSIEYINNLDIKYLLPGHMGISENGNKSVELSYRMVKSMGSLY